MESHFRQRACLMPAVQCTATWCLAGRQQARLQNLHGSAPASIIFACCCQPLGCRVASILHEHAGQSAVLPCIILWLCRGSSGLALACTCWQRRRPMLHSSSGSHAWALLRVVAPHSVQYQAGQARAAASWACREGAAARALALRRADAIQRQQGASSGRGSGSAEPGQRRAASSSGRGGRTRGDTASMQAQTAQVPQQRGPGALRPVPEEVLQRRRQQNPREKPQAGHDLDYS